MKPNAGRALAAVAEPHTAASAMWRALLCLLLHGGAAGRAVVGLEAHEQQSPAGGSAMAGYAAAWPGAGAGVPLPDAIRNRAAEDLSIAKAGEAVSKATSKGVLAAQQRLAAEMALEEAAREFKKGSDAVPRGKSAAKEATFWFEEARRHAEHTREVLAEARRLPQEAAEEAAQAIEDQVRKEASAAADLAAAAPPETAQERATEVAKRVAAAVEPYHIGQLRAQKETAVTLAKAKGAAATYTKLVDRAQSLARDAQGEQAAGLTVRAEHTMGVAHQTMEKAVKTRAEAKELYATAEKINSSIRGYQLKQQQAAVKAAAAAAVDPDGATPIAPSLPAAP